MSKCEPPSAPDNLAHIQEITNISNTWETFFTTVIGEIPYVGDILSMFVEIYWPVTDKMTEKEQLWEDMIQNAEDNIGITVKQNLADFEMSSSLAFVQGIGREVNLYITQMNNENASQAHKKNSFYSALNVINYTIPQFQIEKYRYLTMSSYLQIISMTIFLMRDALLKSDEIGFTETEKDTIQNELGNVFSKANKYLADLISEGQATVKNNYPGQYTPLNAFNRYVSLTISSFIDWLNQLTDISINGPFPIPKTEIYSQLYGDDYNPNVTYTPPPGASDKPRIDAMRLWGWDDVDAVQQSYNGEWGPRLGDAVFTDSSGNVSGGSDEPPYGWNGTISEDNPIVATTIAVDINCLVKKIKIGFLDGSWSNVVGGGSNTSTSATYTFQIDGWIVSQIWMQGTQNPNAVSAVWAAIVGLRRADSY